MRLSLTSGPRAPVTAYSGQTNVTGIAGWPGGLNTCATSRPRCRLCSINIKCPPPPPLLQTPSSLLPVNRHVAGETDYSNDGGNRVTIPHPHVSVSPQRRMLMCVYPSPFFPVPPAATTSKSHRLPRLSYKAAVCNQRWLQSSMVHT